MTLIKVDFHCHTYHSYDSLTTIAQLLEAVRQRGIDRVVVTDHNTIAGAREAYQVDPERIIIGEEILTTRGELLAVLVRELVPARLEPRETIKRLREQGAIIIVPHPFDRIRHGWLMEDLLEILPLVDAIEVYNGRCLPRSLNTRAQAFAKEHGIAGTAGSDAHSPAEIGRSSTVLPVFNNADELRQVIGQGKVLGSPTPLHLRFSSTYAKLVKRMATTDGHR